MESPEISFGIRLTEDAFRNFHGACAIDRLTIRSGVEAAGELVKLFCGPPEYRRLVAPDLPVSTLEEVVELAWVACWAVQARHRSGEPREKISIRTQRAWVEELDRCVKRRDPHLSLNSVIACVFTPWGSGWGTHEQYEVRHQMWVWAAKRASGRDYLRRRRMDAPPVGAMFGA